MKWLLQTIGVKDEILAHLDEATLAFQHPVLLWIALALVVPAAWFIDRRQRRNLTTASSALRLALTLCRVLILLILALVLGAPYLKLDYQIEKKPVVAVLFDHSASMLLPAGPFEKEDELTRMVAAAGYQLVDRQVDAETRKALNRISRAKLAQTVFQKSTNAVPAALAKKFEPHYYRFSRGVETIAADPERADLPDPLAPGGEASRIGDALGQALDETGGRQVAGILLFTDGQTTGGKSLAEAAQRCARAGAPLFAFPAGSTTRLRDVAVADVFTSGLVALGDVARVAVSIKSQGFDGRPVKVTLQDGDTLLDSKDLVLRSDELQQMELTFETKEAGTRYLTVNIPVLAEEPDYIHGNNTDLAYVRVSDEKIQTLYIEGLPRWDFRFLKNAIRRDHGLGGKVGREPDILLEAELRRRATAPPDALPATEDDLAAYQTVILGDASPQLLTPAFLGRLEKAVREKGLGLIVMAGPLAMPHLYDTTLTDLLPVRLHPRVSGLEAPVYRPFRLELSPEGLLHPIMRLYDEPERNQNIWGRMPSYYWCAAVKNPSPAAIVLAWNPDVGAQHGMLPLIAWQFSGQGKVLFVGTDSTWLWRQDVADRFFYKFWGQAIRFVARRDETRAKLSRIEVQPVRVQPGQAVRITVQAFAPGGGGIPRTEHKLPIRILGAGTARNVDVVADPLTKGQYGAAFTPAEPGDYRAIYEPGGAAAPVEGRFKAVTGGEEMREVGINRPALDMAASMAGGKLLELPDIGAVLPQLKGDIKYVPVHRETSIWDNWLVLLALAILYSIDVGLRRLTGLM